MIKGLLFLTLVSFGKISFGQDTIQVADGFTAEQLIQYRFFTSVEGLDGTVRNQIKTEFEKYDFTGEEYDCQYHFTFLIELDTCGYISACDDSDDNYGKKKLTEFVNVVRKIILKSNFRAQNQLILSDTTYLFQAFLFSIETSCEPSEVIFPFAPTCYSNDPVVLKDENETVLFPPFTNACEDVDKRTRRRKN